MTMWLPGDTHESIDFHECLWYTNISVDITLTCFKVKSLDLIRRELMFFLFFLFFLFFSLLPLTLGVIGSTVLFVRSGKPSPTSSRWLSICASGTWGLLQQKCGERGVVSPLSTFLGFHFSSEVSSPRPTSLAHRLGYVLRKALLLQLLQRHF